MFGTKILQVDLFIISYVRTAFPIPTMIANSKMSYRFLPLKHRDRGLEFHLECGLRSRLFVYLCCPVWLDLLRCSDPSSNDSYQISARQNSEPWKPGVFGPHWPTES